MMKKLLMIPTYKASLTDRAIPRRRNSNFNDLPKLFLNFSLAPPKNGYLMITKSSLIGRLSMAKRPKSESIFREIYEVRLGTLCCLLC